MNPQQEKALYDLVGSGDLAKASMDDLFRMADEHPYFSAAQYFLTAKLKQSNHPGYPQQLQRTAIHFTNAHWLHYQLNGLAPTETAKQFIERDAVTQPLLDHVAKEEISNLDVAEQFVVKKQEVPVIKDEPIVEALAVEKLPEPIVEEAIVENAPVIIESIVEPVLEIPVIEVAPIAEEYQKVIIAEHPPEEAANILEEKIVAQKEEPSFIEDEETSLPELGNASAISDKLSSLLDEQVAAFKEPITGDVQLEVKTAHQHAIDYFASQGIKADDKQPADNLSRKLHTFTDWLRHMRQTEHEPDDLGTDPELETAILGIAKTSNEAREIVTETMAEVLEKQGKKDKAIQLYIKLSFLNPNKSAYFAAKIQQLKGI